MLLLSNILLVKFDAFSRALHKLNCDSSSSGFPCLQKSVPCDLRDDLNMGKVQEILCRSENRLTFQLLSRVVESRVKLAWIPSVIRRFPLVAQAGIDTEMVKPDKVIYYHYIL
ncbi:unnamed protein product [Hymenolepis diminuta]|uniref:Uncharacterized protein n=1 Tax=Hymenolepis diminuta TaxID=6216 RepID=A0A564YEN3_HYMDI|nr:unnamed protein product [Hymenolepis diminuta]